MKKLKIALDWTPNINHIGFFVAQELGFYKDSGLDVTIIDPSQDNYKTTPAKKVENGDADFALCPTESIISYQTKANSFHLIGIAAILKKDLSAIVVKSDSGIKSPRDLDGKKYSSYEARYEDEIVRQMIINDGGQGEFKIGYPEKLGIWDTVLDGEFDATWIFLNWEGVAAEAMETPVRYFKMEDYDIPYSYSPVLVANGDLLDDRKTDYSKFLEATAKGFLHCKEYPQESIALFKKYVPSSDVHINLDKALELSLPSFDARDNWGLFDSSIIGRFVDWIKYKKLETKTFEAADLFTNSLLEK
ncbi:ABC transporter substrate-binding protein [Nonlabens sp. Hel1_33_55]|uniref:ABC transporter substrate-binding protein n=1 Tax=Nonlabens sp. Hel1_33_55 TaxID=1336802 RepID=UPI000B819013|nr:ABC transporter substrate-binding protein [Nonlabens sp. Hel1_33_55]